MFSNRSGSWLILKKIVLIKLHILKMIPYNQNLNIWMFDHSYHSWYPACLHLQWISFWSRVQKYVSFEMFLSLIWWREFLTPIPIGGKSGATRLQCSQKYFQDQKFSRNFLDQRLMKLSLAMSSRASGRNVVFTKESPRKLSLNVSFFSPKIICILPSVISTIFKKVNKFLSLISI